MMPPALSAIQLGRIPALRAAQTPAWFWRLAKLFAVILVVLPVVLLFVPWQQNVRGEGRAVAYAPLERQQEIEAPINGRVTHWWVAEGSEVSEGDPLFEITDNDPNLIQRLREQSSAYRAKLDAAEAKAQAYAEKIVAYERGLELELEVAQQKIRMAEQKVTADERAVEAAEIGRVTAELNFARLEQLKGSGLASTRDWELGRLAIRKAEVELDKAKAALEASRSDLTGKGAARGSKGAEYEAKVRGARAQREEALSDAASARSMLAQLEVKIARQETQRVLAPIAGTVLRLSANRGGEMVKAGDPVAVLVPETEAMAVELWVDGNDMPLLSPGRSVRLQFEGWPAVQFAGWPSVAVGTFGGTVRFVDASDDGSGRFRVVVTPDEDGEPWPSRRFLRQGVRARGWILLEQVTLGFEVWRQMNGFPPVVADAEPKGKRQSKAKLKVGK